MADHILNHSSKMSAVWGRKLKTLFFKLFWIVAALFFSATGLAQTREGTWSVHIVRSPMGDRSYAVASADATETFNGARPRLVIACEVTHDGVSHGPLNVFIDLGAALMLGEHFKDRTKPLPVSTKIDDMSRADLWHQSDTYHELFHDASDADQRAFIRWLSDSKRFMVGLSLGGTSNNKAFVFATAGLKPYVPTLAQACGWHK